MPKFDKRVRLPQCFGRLFSDKENDCVGCTKNNHPPCDFRKACKELNKITGGQFTHN